MPCEDGSSSPGVGEGDRAVLANVAADFEFIKQSSTDPNNACDLRRGYCALSIGANCSESPAIMIRPAGLRDRNTNEMDANEIWPASSMITQSTFIECFLVKLYS